MGAGPLLCDENEMKKTQFLFKDFFMLTITEHFLFPVVTKQLMDGLSRCNLLPGVFDETGGTV